jgi:hypothetical protein
MVAAYQGRTESGRKLEFRFPNSGPIMEVLALVPEARVGIILNILGMLIVPLVTLGLGKLLW